MYMRTSDSSWHPEAIHSILDKWQRRLNKPFLQNKRKAILNNVVLLIVLLVRAGIT